MKNLYTYILFLLAVFPAAAQHNNSYVQYMFNGLLLNPAYAGSQEALNLTTLYRRQWLGIGGAPTTLSFGAHTPLKNKKVSVGLVVEQENIGLFDRTRAGLVYTYRIPFLKGQLAFGTQFGARIEAYNWQRLKTQDSYDPNFTDLSNRIVNPDFGAGTYYHDKNMYAGFSAPSLFGAGFNKFQTLTFNTGGVIITSSELRIKPALLLKYISGSPLSANLSTTFYYKDILGIGLGYTMNTSLMSFADVRINDQLYFGYAYERALNRLSTYTFGSHEVMLRYLFRYKINAINARYF